MKSINVILIILFFNQVLSSQNVYEYNVRDNYLIKKTFKMERINGIDSLIHNEKGMNYINAKIDNYCSRIDSSVQPDVFFKLTHKKGRILKIDSTKIYFPLSGYISYPSSVIDFNQLYNYSSIFSYLKEPIYYNDNVYGSDLYYVRLAMIDEKRNIILYRIEDSGIGSRTFIRKKCKYINEDKYTEIQIDSCSISIEEFESSIVSFQNSYIWIIKPHNIRTFSFADSNLKLFESNAMNYTFIDLHEPESKQYPIMDDFYKAIDYIFELEKKYLKK